MTVTNHQKAVTAGVTDAWDFWLSQHNISTPELIEDATRRAFADWLDDNRQALIDAIAERVAHEATYLAPRDCP